MNQIQQINKNQLMNTVHHSSCESNSFRKEVIFYEYSSLTKFCSTNINKFNKHERNHKMKDINQMSKAELVDHIHSLNKIIENMEHSINELKLKLEASSKDGRKSQVLAILREHTTISILEISKLLNISTKNVSSQLTYLRSDGYAIFTDPNGRKMLVEDNKVDEPVETEDDSSDEDDSAN